MLFRSYKVCFPINLIQKNVWKYSEDVTTHTIETHIYRLRQKVYLNEMNWKLENEKIGKVDATVPGCVHTDHQESRIFSAN